MTCRSVLPLAALLAVLPHLALAQGIPCSSRERIYEFLIDRMGETRRASGDGDQGSRMELFAADTGSWSIIMHLPDGRVCIMANGQGFEATGDLQPARGIPT